MSIALKIFLALLLNFNGDAVAEKLKTLIAEFLKSRFPDVEFVVEVKSRSVNFGANDSVALATEFLGDPRGIKSFKFKVFRDVVREVVVQLKIRTFENVLVARINLKRGEIIPADSESACQVFGVEKIETTNLRLGYVKSFKDVAGMRLNKVLKKGEVAFSDYFEKLPLVKAGERVKVIVVGRNVKIETFGVAKQDGFLNQEIKILNPQSRKIFNAKVSGDGKVLIKIEN